VVEGVDKANSSVSHNIENTMSLIIEKLVIMAIGTAALVIGIFIYHEIRFWFWKRAFKKECEKNLREMMGDEVFEKIWPNGYK